MNFEELIRNCVLEIAETWDFQAADYKMEKTLEDMGFDSLSIVELFVLIGQKTKVKVPQPIIAGVKTPQQILDVLKTHYKPN